MGVHKIVANHEVIERLLVRLAVSRLAEDTEEVVLDFDATDSLIHGDQEGRFFHGYYRNYCFLPLYCFIGEWPVWAQLRTSDRDACDGTVEALEKIVPLIRERFPTARIILRGDSGFARETIFTWCESNEVFYVTGLAKNAALLRHLAPAMFRAKADACVRGGYCTYFNEFNYQTAKSWSRTRRVIGKAQVNPKGENPRFVVTNLPGASVGNLNRSIESSIVREEIWNRSEAEIDCRRQPEGGAKRIRRRETIFGVQVWRAMQSCAHPRTRKQKGV